MATIIRIDPDDELPAILERLPSGASCVLVLPPHARALSSVVGAKLLRRRADALDSRVVVVTDDHAVMAHARTAGVPAAETVDEAQQILAGERDAAAPVAPRHAPIAPRDERNGRHPDGAATPADKAPPSGAVFTAGVRSTRGGQPSFDVDEDDDEPPDDVDVPAAPHDSPAAAGVRGHSGSGPARGRTSSADTMPFNVLTSRTRTARLQLQSGRGLRGLIVPAVLVIVPLLVLLWLANYVLSGLLNPSATLTVRPRPGLISGATTVKAILNLSPKKQSHYLVAMTTINQREQLSAPVPVRGIKLLPGNVATGRVMLANLTPKPLLVPAGTAFSTSNNLSFVTMKSVTLPAAKISFAAAQFGTGTAPIQATIGGSASNVPAGAIDVVPASLGGSLKVENDVPARGGTDRREHVVDPRDLAVAAANLFAALDRQAYADIQRRRSAAGKLDIHTLYAARSAVAPQLAPDHRSATLTLSEVVHAVYVPQADLEQAARAALPPTPGLIPASVAWVSTWRPARAVKRAPAQWIDMAVTARTVPPLDIAGLLRAISGRSKSDAQTYLRRRPDLASAAIELSPPWADHVPSDVTRIHVNVESAR